MTAKETTDYSAPQITGHRDLEGGLQFKSELTPLSDAMIKHSVSAVSDYRAPSITSREDLQGSLIPISSDLDSDAEIKHAVEPVEGYEAPAISDERDLEAGLITYKSVD